MAPCSCWAAAGGAPAAGSEADDDMPSLLRGGCPALGGHGGAGVSQGRSRAAAETEGELGPGWWNLCGSWQKGAAGERAGQE